MGVMTPIFKLLCMDLMSGISLGKVGVESPKNLFTYTQLALSTIEPHDGVTLQKFFLHREK